MYHCYSLEATASGGWFRAQHAWHELEVVIDPIRHTQVNPESFVFGEGCENRPKPD